MSSIATVLEHLKTQRVDYSIVFLSNPDVVRIEVRGDAVGDAVGEVEDKQRRRIVIYDGDKNDGDDDDTLDLYKECSATKTDNKKRKTTPEESLRGQCSLRKVDVEKLIKTDIISSLELLRQYLYSHAKSSGVTLGPKQHYSTISSYAKDHLGEVVAQLHSEYPSRYYSCVVTGEKERPHSLRRRS